MNKTYRDVYSNEFLEKFGPSRNAVEQLPWDEQSPIDVRKIIEASNITIYPELGDISGKCNPKERCISVNIFEPEYRQRFTLAHELGHILLNHKGEELFRHDDITKYQNIIEQINEQDANQFAAELLMPRAVISHFLKSVLNDIGANMQESFGSVDTNYIISQVADKLNVSPSAAKYRLQNLNMLITE